MGNAWKNEVILEPVKKAYLSKGVADKLREVILDGSLKTGQRIVEQEIATLLETSRGTVREALVTLEREGLVVKKPRRGTVVVTMSAQDVEEVWSLRAALESLALRYAMQRITEEDLTRLKNIVVDILTCIRTNFSLQKGIRLDLKFHECLVNASGHTRLISCWKDLKQQIQFLMFSHNVGDKEAFRKNAGISHQKIIDAIRRKELDLAIKILKEHEETSYLNLIAACKKSA